MDHRLRKLLARDFHTRRERSCRRERSQSSLYSLSNLLTDGTSIPVLRYLHTSLAWWKETFQWKSEAII